MKGKNELHLLLSGRVRKMISLSAAVVCLNTTPAAAFSCHFPVCYGPFENNADVAAWLNDAGKAVGTFVVADDPVGGSDLIVELQGHGECRESGSLKTCVCTSESLPAATACNQNYNGVGVTGETTFNPDGSASHEIPNR